MTKIVKETTAGVPSSGSANINAIPPKVSNVHAALIRIDDIKGSNFLSARILAPRSVHITAGMRT